MTTQKKVKIEYWCGKNANQSFQDENYNSDS